MGETSFSIDLLNCGELLAGTTPSRACTPFTFRPVFLASSATSYRYGSSNSDATIARVYRYEETLFNSPKLFLASHLLAGSPGRKRNMRGILAHNFALQCVLKH
jgi:hypothetical protein